MSKSFFKIQNMLSPKGNLVPNQFEIFTAEGVFFQSYSTIIAFKPTDVTKKTILNANAWNYSRTTARYRNIFLGETTAAATSNQATTFSKI